MRRQRKLEWEEAQRLEMETRFNFNNPDAEQGVALSSTVTSVDTPGNTPSKRPRTGKDKQVHKNMQSKITSVMFVQQTRGGTLALALRKKMETLAHA